MTVESRTALDTLPSTIVHVTDYAQAVKEFLNTEGWIQGQFHNEFGYCLAGAMDEVSRRNNVSEKTVWSAVLAIQDKIGLKSLANWNDYQGRTKEEVLDMLASISNG